MTDEVVLYEPFQTRKPQRDPAIASTLRFLRISLSSWVSGESALTGQDRVAPMRVIPNLDGNAMVFIPGEHPSFLLRAASATPKIVRLRGNAIKGLSGFHTKKCERGLAYVDSEVRMRALWIRVRWMLIIVRSRVLFVWPNYQRKSNLEKSGGPLGRFPWDKGHKSSVTIRQRDRMLLGQWKGLSLSSRRTTTCTAVGQKRVRAFKRVHRTSCY